MDDSSRVLIQNAEHITDISGLEEVDSMNHQSYRSQSCLAKISLNFGFVVSCNHVDASVSIEIFPKFLLDSFFLLFEITGHFGLSDGDDEIFTVVAKFSGPQDALVPGPDKVLVEELLSFLLVGDTDGVLVGSRFLRVDVSANSMFGEHDSNKC